MHFSPALVSLLLATVSVNARNHPKRCDDETSTSASPSPTGYPSSPPDVPSTPNVPGRSINFSTFDSSKQTAEQFLNEMGYMLFSYTIENDGVAGSIPRTFEKRNVDIVDGALRLLVRGQSGQGTISSGEIESYESVTFGTLETIAKATPTPGVCQGIFFYESDNAEVDIELLSSYYETGYKQYLDPGVAFTNQALVKDGDSTSVSQEYGFDPTADFHNYTIRWTESVSEFYVDGELRETLDTNVPSIASKIIYNNWSNGDPKWSAGPPREDAYFEIKSFKYTPL